MKVPKIVLSSLVAIVGTLFASDVSLAQPMGGMGMGEGMGGGRGAGCAVESDLSEESFNEMKQLFLNNDYASFKTTMKSRQEKQQKIDDSVTRTITKLTNGIVMTMTSTDSTVVAKLQSSKEEAGGVPEDTSMTKVSENITNGVRITMTSTDADTVTRLQAMSAEQPGGNMMSKPQSSQKSTASTSAVKSNSTNATLIRNQTTKKSTVAKTKTSSRTTYGRYQSTKIAK